MNILFLCTGNSCRSIIAEALLRSVAPKEIIAQSAGSNPSGFIHPRAIKILAEAGINTEGLSSKSQNGISKKPDVVITLCSEARGEACSQFFEDAIRSHWGLSDPAQTEEALIEKAFSETFTKLNKMISALVKHIKIKPDISKKDLQAIIDDIATKK